MVAAPSSDLLALYEHVFGCQEQFSEKLVTLDIQEESFSAVVLHIRDVFSKNYHCLNNVLIFIFLGQLLGAAYFLL